MNTGSGKELNWFWKSWFIDSGVPDLAIANVSSKQNDYSVTIKRVGSKPTPIDLTVYNKDGSTQAIHQSIACWEKGNGSFTVNFTTNKPIEKIVLGGIYDPDSNKGNNVWVAK